MLFTVNCFVKFEFIVQKIGNHSKKIKSAFLSLKYLIRRNKCDRKTKTISMSSLRVEIILYVIF